MGFHLGKRARHRERGKSAEPHHSPSRVASLTPFFEAIERHSSEHSRVIETLPPLPPLGDLSMGAVLAHLAELTRIEIAKADELTDA